MTAVTHARAEARSLALHREVAHQLAEHPELLERARARVREWAESDTVSSWWVKQWAEVLARPLGEIVAVLTDPGQESCDLRQASPFAGVLDPRTRWAILRSHRDEVEAP
jgi:hypothetical protein